MMESPLPVHRASCEMEDFIPNISLAIQFTCFRVYWQNLSLPLHKSKFLLMPNAVHHSIPYQQFSAHRSAEQTYLFLEAFHRLACPVAGPFLKGLTRTGKVLKGPFLSLFIPPAMSPQRSLAQPERDVSCKLKLLVRISQIRLDHKGIWGLSSYESIEKKSEMVLNETILF